MATGTRQSAEIYLVAVKVKGRQRGSIFPLSVFCFYSHLVTALGLSVVSLIEGKLKPEKKKYFYV